MRHVAEGILLSALVLGASPAGGDEPVPAARAWVAGDIDRALAALDATPASRDRDLNRAVVLLHRGDATASEQILRRLYAEDGAWTPALRWLARSQYRLGRPETPQAVESLLASTGADGRDHLWAAAFFEEHGQAARARESYLRALRDENGLYLAWVGLSRAEAALGNRSAAAQAEQRARDLFVDEDAAPLPSPVLTTPERLTYKVRYLWLTLGWLTLETHPAPAQRGVYRVVVNMRSNPSIPFFHIDSRFESLLDAQGRMLTHWNTSSDSDTGRRSAGYDTDSRLHRCRVRYVQDGRFGFDDLPLPVEPQDGVSVLQLARAVARAGVSLSVPTAVDTTWKGTRLQAVGREAIRWEGRNVDTVRVQSAGAYKGPGGLSGLVDLWVSDDDQAIPYRGRMKIAVGSITLELTRGASEAAAVEPVETELGRLRHRHDRHHPRLHGIGDHEVGRLGDTARHVEADDEQALLPDLPHRLLDVAAHERPGQDEDPGPRQPGHRAHGVGQRLLSHERDGVHRDVLAPDVVAVGLGDGPQGHLAHLGAAAHDDDPLAVDPLERFHQGDLAHHGERGEVHLQGLRSGRQRDLEVRPAACGTVLEDLDERDVGAVGGEDAAQLVQHPGAGGGLDEEADGLGGSAARWGCGCGHGPVRAG